MYYTHLYGEIRKSIILLKKFFDNTLTYETYIYAIVNNVSSCIKYAGDNAVEQSKKQ